MKRTTNLSDGDLGWLESLADDPAAQDRHARLLGRDHVVVVPAHFVDGLLSEAREHRRLRADIDSAVSRP